MACYDVVEFNYCATDFNQDIILISHQITTKYNAVYGIARGGINVAIALSLQLKIPLISSLDDMPHNKNILVVDDIVDSGTTRNQFTQYDFACLHLKTHANITSLKPLYFVHKTNKWIKYFWEQNEQPAEDAIIRIIELIGDNPNRPGLKDTPKRVSKMYQEIFRGYNEKQRPLITIFENHTDGIRSTGILRDSGYFFSFCEHHMLPFFGHFWYGYIPDKFIMGASKIARIIDYYAARLQVAERLCYDVIEEIEERVKPKGSVLIMNARHLCKEMRGVKKFDSLYEVNEARGFFLENKDGCKDEFLSRIGTDYG